VSADIVELKSRPAQVVESVVERLEEVLAAAREGRIVSVAIATISVDGSLGSAWSETDDFGKLVGAVARLQHRLNVNQDSA
jgi:hypothetical protein